mmetsp:Transcript_18660/g.44562  ORF Transcript_18660/g.44562 Transcript_18660/m.44562 type:complete len:413 (-) Transcript_18660:744-1982(-)
MLRSLLPSTWSERSIVMRPSLGGSLLMSLFSRSSSSRLTNRVTASGTSAIRLLLSFRILRLTSGTSNTSGGKVPEETWQRTSSSSTWSLASVPLAIAPAALTPVRSTRRRVWKQLAKALPGMALIGLEATLRRCSCGSEPSPSGSGHEESLFAERSSPVSRVQLASLRGGTPASLFWLRSSSPNCAPFSQTSVGTSVKPLSERFRAATPLLAAKSFETLSAARAAPSSPKMFPDRLAAAPLSLAPTAPPPSGILFRSHSSSLGVGAETMSRRISLSGFPSSSSFLRVVMLPSSGGTVDRLLSVRSRRESLSWESSAGIRVSLFRLKSRTDSLWHRASSAGSSCSSLCPACSSTSDRHPPISGGSALRPFSRRSRTETWASRETSQPAKLPIRFWRRLRSLRPDSPSMTSAGG